MNKSSGFIALTSLLVIASLVVLIGVSTSLLSIGDLQSSFSLGKSEDALDLAEACSEEALLGLNEDGVIPASITLPEGACSITINSNLDNTWDFTVEGTLDFFTKRVNIVATRGTFLAITSWKESE